MGHARYTFASRRSPAGRRSPVSRLTNSSPAPGHQIGRDVITPTEAAQVESPWRRANSPQPPTPPGAAPSVATTLMPRSRAGRDASSTTHGNIQHRRRCAPGLRRCSRSWAKPVAPSPRRSGHLSRFTGRVAGTVPKNRRYRDAQHAWSTGGCTHTGSMTTELVHVNLLAGHERTCATVPGAFSPQGVLAAFIT